MKKLLKWVSAAFILLLSQSAGAQNIPGNDFEEWESKFFVEQPVGWLTSSLANPFAEVKSVTKTDDAFHGKYAVRLETVLTEYEGEETVLTGFAVTGSMNMTGYTMGFPCQFRPKMLSFYYKYYPVFQDSMVINIVLQKSDPEYGVRTIGSGTFIGTERVEEYTQGKAQIEYESQETPDTAVIVVLSGVDTIHVGSVLYLDFMNLDFNLGKEEVMQKDILVQAVYPQPASGKVFFPVSLPASQKVDLEITDMTGRKMAYVQQQAPAGNTQIPVDVSSWKPGVYLYRIGAGNIHKTGKIVVSGN